MNGFLTFVAFATVYILIAAFTGKGLMQRWLRTHAVGSGDEGFFAFWGGLFWPIMVPVMVGIIAREKVVAHGNKPSKDALRRKREIEEAEHRLALAKIEAKAIAASEQNAGLR